MFCLYMTVGQNFNMLSEMFFSKHYGAKKSDMGMGTVVILW